MFTAEPEGFDDDLALVRAAVAREANDKVSGSICDALMSNTPGEWTFPITQALIGRGHSRPATPKSGARCVYAFEELKLVVEPGGAIGLAALLAGKLEIKGKVVVADLVRAAMSTLEMFAKLIAS